jgi:hypothetical protein
MERLFHFLIAKVRWFFVYERMRICSEKYAKMFVDMFGKWPDMEKVA